MRYKRNDELEKQKQAKKQKMYIRNWIIAIASLIGIILLRQFTS
jgi:hypothetical protein